MELSLRFLEPTGGVWELSLRFLEPVQQTATAKSVPQTPSLRTPDQRTQAADVGRRLEHDRQVTTCPRKKSALTYTSCNVRLLCTDRYSETNKCLAALHDCGCNGRHWS